MKFTLLLYSAFLPVALFLIWIYKKDTKKEPPGLLLKCFMWGCVVTMPIILLTEWLSDCDITASHTLCHFFDAFVVAALLQEGAKFLCLYLIIWKSSEFDQYFDGIVYAVFVSLGFALMENMGNVLLPYLIDLDIYIAFHISILRWFLDVPAHGLFGVIMGYFFAMARFSKSLQPKKWLFFSFCVPFILNGIYNFSLLQFAPMNVNTFAFLLLVFMIPLCIVVIIRIRVIKEKDRVKEIEDN